VRTGFQSAESVLVRAWILLGIVLVILSVRAFFARTPSALCAGVSAKLPIGQSAWTSSDSMRTS